MIINYLKAARLIKGLSQKEMAQMLGIHEATYCRLERGWYAKPPSKFDEKIASVAWPWPNVTFDILMKEVPVPPPGKQT